MGSRQETVWLNEGMGREPLAKGGLSPQQLIISDSQTALNMPNVVLST